MKKFCLSFICLFLFKNFVTAQDYKRVWVSVNHDSTADNINLSDMVVDANGNTYMCGYELDPADQYYETHLYVLKVNAAGKLEWKHNFNNKKDSIDEAIAIAVDTAGFVYVTGTRIDTFCNICTYNTKISDIITMKYNPNGERLWLNRYHNADYILAEASDIALSPDGTILITGNETRYVPELGTDISKLLIQKITRNGKTIWVKTMDDVVGNTGCFDNDNNIVVAGASDPSHLYQSQKPMVLKFRPNGNLVWSSIFNEYNKNGRLYFVQCDSANNIYANGQTDTLTFYNVPRIVTIKYNSSGQQQWFKKEANRTTTMAHFYGDFEVDAAGNSYLTGYVNDGGSNDDWVITKYSSAGAKRWSNTFSNSLGSDKPIGLAVDKKGNTYVAGYVLATGGRYAIATAAYNRNGELLGSDIFGNRSSIGFASGIGLDKNNNVYVGGTFGINANPYPASIVIKYGLNVSAAKAANPAPEVTSELKLFPNPVINSLNVTFNTSMPAKSYRLAVHDVSGNIVLSKQINSPGKLISTNVDVSRLKPGVYTVNIYSGAAVLSKTFIKE